MRNIWLSLGCVVLLALLGWAQTYGPGEIYYGGIRLQFSGQVRVAGTCSSPIQLASGVSQIQCQVPEGVAGTIELTATRTPAGAVNIRVESVPSGWPNSLWVQQLGQWVDSRSSAASGWGTITAQYRFTPPAGSAGRQFTLRFKAWTAGVPGELELRVILDVVRSVTSPPTEPITPPSYGPFTGTTDGTGRFEVPIPTLPNTSVTGQLTECTVKPLPNQQVSVTLVPKPGVTTISRIDQIGAVRVSSPGYGEVEITQLGLASSMDMFGRVYATVAVGTVCLRPTGPTQPATPTAPISGKTDSEGKFSVPLPWPGATVSGRLTECTVKPLPNQEFTLTLVPKGETLASPEDIAAFAFKVPGYQETTVTQFSKLSLFGLTWYDTGPVCLYSIVCREVELQVLSWNTNLLPTFAKFVGQRIPHVAASVKGFDIVCLQEVFAEDGKSAIAEAWFGQKTVVTWNGQLERDKEKELQLDGAKVRLLGAMPNDEGTEIAVLRQGNRYIVAGPDSWCPDPITGIDWETTQDGGLMILSTYPIVAASGMIWSDQTGFEELGAKGALYARIQLDPENSECYIHVFSTHLAARDLEFSGPDGRGQVPHPDKNWEARKKQIEELVAFISNCIRDDKVGHPIILCGDFNVIAPFPANWGGDLVVPAKIDATKAIPSPQYDELMKLLAAHKLTDAWKEKLAGVPGFTWLGNDWQTQPGSPWGDKGNPLATGPGWPQQLDYILYNAGAERSPLVLCLDTIGRTQWKMAKPFQWGETQGYVPSDHVGLIAKFTVSPR